MFLSGMTSATSGWDDIDVANARPALEPWRGIFDRGRMIGLDMREKNDARRRNLQSGLTGKVWRVLFGRAAEKARKDAIPRLPGD